MSAAISPVLVRLNMKESDEIRPLDDFHAISLIQAINQVVFYGPQSFEFNFNPDNFPENNFLKFISRLDKKVWWVCTKEDGQFFAINLGKIQRIQILKNESLTRIFFGKDLCPVDIDLDKEQPLSQTWGIYKMSMLGLPVSASKVKEMTFGFDFEAADMPDPELLPTTPNPYAGSSIPPTPVSLTNTPRRSTPLGRAKTPSVARTSPTPSRGSKRKVEQVAGKKLAPATPTLIQRKRRERKEGS